MKFKFLTGPGWNWPKYGGKFISPKLSNSDFDYWLVIEVINWLDAVGEREAPAKYCVSLYAVSPSEAGEKNLQAALESCGYDETVHSLSDEMKVEMLSEYGVQAQVHSQNGDNLQELLKETRKLADLHSIHFGFWMDRAQNRIGSSGWDFLRGDF